MNIYQNVKTLATLRDKNIVSYEAQNESDTDRDSDSDTDTDMKASLHDR